MINYFYQGGPVMYPLLFCSLISLTIVIERGIFWMREKKRRDRKLLERFMSLVEKGDLEEAREVVADSRDPVVRVLVCGIVHRGFSLKEALRMSADEEIARMRRYLPILDTMITLSPLLGILGTVTGIIYSFNMLGSAGVEKPRNDYRGNRTGSSDHRLRPCDSDLQSHTLQLFSVYDREGCAGDGKIWHDPGDTV